MKTRLLALLLLLCFPVAPYAADSAAMAKYTSGNENQVQIPLANTGKDLSTVTITTITTVWTPASGKKFRLMGGTISVSAGVNVLFEDNTAGSTHFVCRTPTLEADKPFTFIVLGGQGKLSAAADNVLKATASGAATITGTLWGTEE